MPTFPQVLDRRLRHEPGRPFLTYYDVASGERTELSLTSWANWVAKASSLLADELDLARGDTLRVDLTPHWLGTVFLGAAWNTGLVLTDDADAPDAVLCGPTTLARWAGRADDVVVLATALRPLGQRFVDPVPAGVHDVGVEIWGQPDAFVAFDAPADDDPAVAFRESVLTQGALLTPRDPSDQPGRLLVATDQLSAPAAVPQLLADVLAGTGSLVLVADADEPQLAGLAETERATR